MSELPGELKDSDRSVEGDAWREVRGGRPAQRQLPERTGAGRAPSSREDSEQSEHWLGRIALYYVAHPTIPNLYQCCFDYTEPWDWSRQTEHVTTGRWIHLSRTSKSSS